VHDVDPFTGCQIDDPGGLLRRATTEALLSVST